MYRKTAAGLDETRGEGETTYCRFTRCWYASEANHLKLEDASHHSHYNLVNKYAHTQTHICLYSKHSDDGKVS